MCATVGSMRIPGITFAQSVTLRGAQGFSISMSPLVLTDLPSPEPAGKALIKIEAQASPLDHTRCPPASRPSARPPPFTRPRVPGAQVFSPSLLTRIITMQVVCPSLLTITITLQVFNPSSFVLRDLDVMSLNIYTDDSWPKTEKPAIDSLGVKFVEVSHRSRATAAQWTEPGLVPPQPSGQSQDLVAGRRSAAAAPTVATSGRRWRRGCCPNGAVRMALSDGAVRMALSRARGVIWPNTEPGQATRNRHRTHGRLAPFRSGQHGAWLLATARTVGEVQGGGLPLGARA